MPQDMDSSRPQPTDSEVLRNYFQQFDAQNHLTGVNKDAFCQGESEECNEASDNIVHAELMRAIGLQERGAEAQAAAEDSCDEDVSLCHKCGLPLGEKAYRRDGKVFHGECMAQSMVHAMADEDKAKQQEVCRKKQARRAAYGIGWDASRIPRNEGPAGKLAIREVPEGLVCLVMDTGDASIRIASTTEPAAAVNLEYLSTALEVRRREGHEPIFSLDPVDASSKDSMLSKLFVPDWLAGTSVGEVLFQADYHLKELSMGEYEQPVVGMKSCFDYSESGGEFQAWNGREWFLVRKAEIQVSDSNTLVPYVKMGVEAREQVICGSGLEDKQITRQDHPLVKYAEAFTRNFDLIAERKSVINQLRELAKASVLARHLLDANVKLDEAWFHLAENEFASSLEVPPLWNERLHSKIHVQDGSILRDRDQKNSRMHGVYGGVQFGLDKLNLSTMVARTAPPAAGKLGLTPARVSRQVPPAASVVATSLNLAAGVSRRAKYGDKSRVLLQGVEMKPELNGKIAKVLSFEGGADRRYAVQVAGETFSLRESKLSPLLATQPAAAGGEPIAAAVPAQASVSTGMLPLPARAAPSLRVDSIQEASTVAAAAASKPVEAASSVDKFSLLTGADRPNLISAATSRIKPLQVSVAPQASIPAGRLTSAGLSQKVSAAPMADIASMVSGAAFAAPPPAAAITDLRAAKSAARTEARPLLGVDLRLDNFDLSSSKRVSLEAQAGSWGGEAKPLGECRHLGKAFWDCLGENPENLEKRDHDLLNAIYNPELSDRRCEGDIFVPPDASYANVTRLRALVNEEDKIRQRRKEQFYSKDFMVDSPGSVFPTSWTPSVEVACGRASAQAGEGEGRRQRSLRACPEYHKGEAAALLQRVLSTVRPTFDRITEDGLRFLIYQVGSLEVRTTQDVNGKETIGAVYSLAVPVDANNSKNCQEIQGQETIAKATMYVERACVMVNGAPSFSFHYYVVLETGKGQKIVTERLSTGKAVWSEDVVNVEDRNSLAKVMHSAERCVGVTVDEVRARYHQIVQTGKVTASAGKRYAKMLFSLAATSGAQK